MNTAGDDAHGRIYFHTNTELVGVGWSFSNGQGNEVLCTALHAFAPRYIGQTLASLVDDFATTHREAVSGQIRFMSPERGVMQLATCAVLNAIWDLWAKSEKKPLWRLVCDMTPKEYVQCIDFRYLTDAITPEEAIALLQRASKGREEREKVVKESRAVPGYSTSIGGLGTSDEGVEELLTLAVEQGFTRFKLRLGLGVERDKKRLAIIRRIAGWDATIFTDANEQWDVPTAVWYLPQLAEFKPVFIEEPTSPDDILGHAKVRAALKEYNIGVATGEHVNNRVMFKQFLQAEAVDYLQLDAVRLSGVNEILSVLLLAAKFKVPIVPHSGGVGMVELCQHISTIDYLMVSGKESMMEYTKHHHDDFLAGAQVEDGYHTTPSQPGYSSDLHPWVYDKYECPNGSYWKSEQGLTMLQDKWRGVIGRQTS
ncbi:hypothetical protein M231_07904 [Tremella mesenterica]|uniref:Mandelate racemase/muconate lactonizing enzyme C-terminal domain-containing protein n=2 Tax=Tremella mesenterica TaxID=5217 RepID=A0A4Q1B897_TREME|nr:hypothetical protein M231_07904 [Tremella mesenterica]